MNHLPHLQSCASGVRPIPRHTGHTMHSPATEANR